MFNLDRKKINKFLEYAIIVILFFIAIKKGGYYKQDSLIGICLIQIVSTIIYFINIKKDRKYNIVNILLLIFSFSYLLPIIFGNVATISGSINSWSRMYTFLLIFCIVQNSENKCMYKKGIVITTIVVGILGIDEIGLRLFEPALNLLGSGYLEEKTSKLSSVLQYSNLVGLLCIVSSIFVLEYIIKNKDSKEIKYKLLNVVYDFFTIIILLTQSKMSIILFILSNMFFLVRNKRYNGIVKFCLNFVFSFVITMFNSWIVVLVGSTICLIYQFIMNCQKFSDKEKIIDVVLIILIIVAIIINFNLVLKSENVIRFKNYFSSFDSTVLRITYYTDALKLWKSDVKSILFGLGGNAFRIMYETVQTKEYISLEVHSMFIQILLESGIIGLSAILFAILYSIIKGNDKTIKLLIVIISVFAMFDVYVTYTYMLILFAIILALSDIKTDITLLYRDKIVLAIVIIMMLMFNIKICLGYVFSPAEVNNANNSLEEQEKIIKKCELSLLFDPYELSYVENYTNACKTYLDIMDIKKQIYGEDDVSKRIEIVDKMYINVNNMLDYESQNKYVIEDAISVVYKYVDYLVMKNYDVNVLEGYEYYLEYIVNNIEKIEENHKFNEAAKKICSNIRSNVYDKFSDLNVLLHSQKIENILKTIEEKENISL